MNGLLIIGAGGHGKVVADAALAAGWRDIAFVDDRVSTLGSPLGLPVVGALLDLDRCVSRFQAAVVGVGGAGRRLQLIERCRSLGFALPSILHPTATVSPSARIGAGCVVFAQAVLNPDAELGCGCIVNTAATVDHDCRLGEGVHVCPGAHLAGSVRVGDRSWIGIGAVVRQGICIGCDVMVGAGAAVVKDVDDGKTVIGVPAAEKYGQE